MAPFCPGVSEQSTVSLISPPGLWTVRCESAHPGTMQPVILFPPFLRSKRWPPNLRPPLQRRFAKCSARARKRSLPSKHKKTSALFRLSLSVSRRRPLHMRQVRVVSTTLSNGTISLGWTIASGCARKRSWKIRKTSSWCTRMTMMASDFGVSLGRKNKMSPIITIWRPSVPVSAAAQCPCRARLCAPRAPRARGCASSQSRASCS
jgi:hypothetical protein